MVVRTVSERVERLAEYKMPYRIFSGNPDAGQLAHERKKGIAKAALEINTERNPISQRLCLDSKLKPTITFIDNKRRFISTQESEFIENKIEYTYSGLIGILETALEKSQINENEIVKAFNNDHEILDKLRSLVKLIKGFSNSGINVPFDPTTKLTIQNFKNPIFGNQTKVTITKEALIEALKNSISELQKSDIGYITALANAV